MNEILKNEVFSVYSYPSSSIPFEPFIKKFIELGWNINCLYSWREPESTLLKFCMKNISYQSEFRTLLRLGANPKIDCQDALYHAIQFERLS